MGAVIKMQSGKRKSSQSSEARGSVVAYPGINMREVEKMFNYLKRHHGD